MKRVLILGPSGSGKSTLATKIGQKFNLPVTHLDACFFDPGWVIVDKEIFKNRMMDVASKDSWVIDGNYTSITDAFVYRLERADTIIFLKFSRWFCLWSVLKRFFKHRGTTRPDMREGCDEKIDWDFIKYIWNFPKKSYPRIYSAVKEHGQHAQFITLRNFKETENFLNNL